MLAKTLPDMVSADLSPAKTYRIILALQSYRRHGFEGPADIDTLFAHAVPAGYIEPYQTADNEDSERHQRT